MNATDTQSLLVATMQKIARQERREKEEKSRLKGGCKRNGEIVNTL